MPTRPDLEANSDYKVKSRDEKMRLRGASTDL